MVNNYTGKVGYKCYANQNDCMISSYDIAITCNRCREPLLVEFDLITEESIAYELTDLGIKQKQKIHRHQCDSELRHSVIKAVAVEKWYLHDQNRTFKN